MIGRLVGIYEETCCSVRFVCVKYRGDVDYANLGERETCLRDRIVMLLFEKFHKFLPSKERKKKKKEKKRKKRKEEI